MSSIETQITAAWTSSTQARPSGEACRAVAARDLMTYDVPAHELSPAEVQTVEEANHQAAQLETAWYQQGPEGFVKATGCKLVGVWLGQPQMAANIDKGTGTSAVRNHHNRGSASGIDGSGEATLIAGRGSAVDGDSANTPKLTSQLDHRGDERNIQGGLGHTTSSGVTLDTTKPRGKESRLETSRGSSFHRHPTRHVALLFVYQGWHYSGLAIQQMPTPLPTVEGELLKALEKTHLIEAGSGWEGCEFSRCGRTDRGVSSAGQVVSLRLKSKRHPEDGGVPLHIGADWQPAREPRTDPTDSNHGTSDSKASDLAVTPQERIAMRIAGDYIAPPLTPDALAKMPLRQQLKAVKKKKIVQPESGARTASEYSYPHILNRVLPPEIRVLAWSPLPQDQQEHSHSSVTPFDARFSCITRHYRYFFTRRPIPDHPPLDISLMQAAATRLIGEHDFRNFCKVDGSKQIENHRRRVLKAVVRPDDSRDLSAFEGLTSAEGTDQDAFVFELVGSAFLWHQVRHIMSVLFHVGHGYESPDIVSRLLHTGYHSPAREEHDQDSSSSSPRVDATDNGPPVASKPLYVMGAALPLQLYRCGYDPGAVDWRYGGYDGPVQAAPQDSPARTETIEGHLTVLNALKSQAEEARIKARQIEAFYQEAVAIHRPEGLLKEQHNIAETPATSYTLGAGEMQAGRKYVPFLDRPRGDLVEEQNRRWREGKGENRRLRKLAESSEK